jgi:DUF1680 family protein
MALLALNNKVNGTSARFEIRGFMKYLSALFLSALFTLLAGFTWAAPGAEPFPLSDVHLLDGPFKRAEQTNLRYLLAMEPDRLLAPYLREAGLPLKSESYGNWESGGLDGHIGGHYVTALALMYAATGDEIALSRLNYMIDELKKAQDKNGNGYLGGIPDGDEAWKALASGHIKVDNFSLNDKWVPWYNLHKTYAGLRDAYIYAHNETAKAMLIKLSDWALQLTESLSDEQMELMLRGEYGGMNEIFVDVAEMTGDKKYLTLAKRFSHRHLLNPLLQQQDQLTGIHANTQIPKVIGFKRIADATNDKDWNDAAQFFWETVVEKRSVAIGGNSVKEHFHPADDFQPMIEEIEGPETCNTYNMLKLSKLFYQSSRDLKYLDFYERGLYNHILSSQHPDTGGLVYFTPMRPNHYRVYSQIDKAMWCCVGSGIENHGKYGELIYAHQGDQLYVNLFVSSTLNWRDKKIKLRQETTFPDSEYSTIHIEDGGRFTLNVRYPNWVATKALTVRVNDKPVKITAQPGQYVQIKRNWHRGDKVRVELPMHTRLESMPDQSNYFAVLHGPIVLAAKTQPFPTEKLQYFADDSRMGHIAQGQLCPLDAAPTFVTDDKDFLQKITPVPDKPLTFRAPVMEGDKARDIELIPFFRLHDSRYTLYWPLVSRTEFAPLQAANSVKEKARIALDAMTIDEVNPGQQQPESDHFLQTDDSDMGIHLGRHWRQAKGWFSYVLNDPQHLAATLQVTYFSGDAGRFDIVINDKRVAEVELTARAGEEFYTVDYEIPASLVKAADGKLRVKFVAKEGSIASRVYYVRVLRDGNR